MISESCDLDGFIEAIKDLTYHEVLTSILKEGYEADDLFVSKKRDAASALELEKVRESAGPSAFHIPPPDGEARPRLRTREGGVPEVPPGGGNPGGEGGAPPGDPRLLRWMMAAFGRHVFIGSSSPRLREVPRSSQDR
jgi:hypothetical protein